LKAFLFNYNLTLLKKKTTLFFVGSKNRTLFFFPVFLGCQAFFHNTFSCSTSFSFFPEFVLQFFCGRLPLKTGWTSFSSFDFFSGSPIAVKPLCGVHFSLFLFHLKPRISLIHSPLCFEIPKIDL